MVFFFWGLEVELPRLHSRPMKFTYAVLKRLQTCSCLASNYISHKRSFMSAPLYKSWVVSGFWKKSAYTLRHSCRKYFSIGNLNQIADLFCALNITKLHVSVTKLPMSIKNCAWASQNARERLSWYKVQISYNQIVGSEAAQAKTFWSHASGTWVRI